MNTAFLIVSIFGAILGSLYLLLGLYILVMGLTRAHLAGRLTRAGYVLGWPFVAFGMLANAVMNVTVASLIFLDLPQELAMTQRFKRYIANEPFSWRGRLAQWICDHLLDPTDPHGDHC